MTEEITYLPPTPTRVRKVTICSFAEAQREKTRIKNGFDLPNLVKKNRGELSYIGFMDDDQTDAVVVRPDGSFRIRLSSHTGALRDNFTIAHELGHFVLHWPLVRKNNPGCGMRATRKVDDTNEALRRCEWEANWFASSFLMPEKAFREAYRAGNAAEVFGVTRSAVEVRAKALGIHD
ncbi:ImmA/IrrE family metallo-endopeptidase [Cereibacter johrii]|uniref:ImmA/IrrE family metallo-endopeptidase n=1 Tax=Cereibacter johrii TaxID=445629 RepID=UPI003CF282FB